jgi:hypothetical protein
MREFFAVFKVGFSSFVLCCTLKSVGPGYANALRQEASHLYTPEEIHLNQLKVEGAKNACSSLPNREFVVE